MADLYKLSDGTSSVDIDPTRGLNIAENRIRQTVISKEGLTDTHEWGNAELYEIPLINLPKAKTDQLLQWWLDMEVLTFTPDQGVPGTTHQMVIDGVERPLDMWHHLFKSKYAGTLKLYEVSSQSFSESEISVSQSKSCSQFGASESCSQVASLSCSAFIVGISRTSVSGTENVAVPSCSTYRSCSEFSTSDIFRSCSTFSTLIASEYWTASSCDDASVVTSDSSCQNLSSCSDSLSGSLSNGVIEVTLGSQSCSLDPSGLSCSESAAGESCSESAGGIT